MTGTAVFVNTAAPAALMGNAAVAIPNPGTRSAASIAMMPRIELMRATYGGTETMRQMGRLFLPQFRRESETRYTDRLNMTTCVNKVREAVDAASAKPFRNLIYLKDAPDDLQEWSWNADGVGHHLHLVGHSHFNEACNVGLHHILVDHPTTTDLPNLAAQRAMNPQPFLRRIRAEDLLAAYYDTVGGEKACVHARFSTSRTGFDPVTFSEVTIDQIYVVEPYVAQVWERERIVPLVSLQVLGEGGSVQTTQPLPYRYLPITQAGAAGGDWKLVRESRHDLDRVPLETMVAGEEEALHQIRPVFQDLAYKQIEHWQSTSEQRNILSSARFPMLASSGVDVDEESGPDGNGFEIGPWVILTSPDPQGRWYFVEPKGNAIEAGAKDIASIEYQMDMMALNPVQATNRQYVPQNERSLAETRVNSVVHDLAIGCKDSLEKCIQHVGRWKKVDYRKVSVEMNFNFSGTDELSAKITAILDAVAKGVLSRQAALANLVRLNLLTEDFDVEAELKQPSAQAEMTTQTSIAEQVPGTGDTEPRSKSERDFPKGQTRPTAQN